MSYPQKHLGVPSTHCSTNPDPLTLSPRGAWSSDLQKGPKSGEGSGGRGSHALNELSELDSEGAQNELDKWLILLITDQNREPNLFSKAVDYVPPGIR